MSRSISPAAGGAFAGGRRGALDSREVNIALDLKAKGRSVQFIATYLGRSMEDVARLFQPASVSPSPPHPERKPRAEAFSKDVVFSRMWLADVPLPVIEGALHVSRSKMLTMRVRLGLPPRIAPPSRS